MDLSFLSRLGDLRSESLAIRAKSGDRLRTSEHVADSVVEWGAITTGAAEGETSSKPTQLGAQRSFVKT